MKLDGPPAPGRHRSPPMYALPPGRVVGRCYRCVLPVREAERTIIFADGAWRFVVHRACRVYADGRIGRQNRSERG